MKQSPAAAVVLTKIQERSQQSLRMKVATIRKYCNTGPILKKVLAIVPIGILYCNINNPVNMCVHSPDKTATFTNYYIKPSV